MKFLYFFHAGSKGFCRRPCLIIRKLSQPILSGAYVQARRWQFPARPISAGLGKRGEPVTAVTALEPGGIAPYAYRAVLQMMRILNIMLAKVRGGVETMGLRYDEALRAEGFEVLSLGHPQGTLAQGVASDGFRALTCASGFDLSAALKLRRHVRDFQPHMILTHGNRAAGLALTPFLGTAERTVQVLHNSWFKPHVARAKAVMCVSGSVRDELARAYPGVRAVDMANFSHLSLSPVKTAPRKPPIIGALGRLDEIKGFDVLLRAAAQLRDLGVDFRLRLAGDGPEMGALKALSESLGLGDRVEFVGWVRNPGDFLKTIDLFVMPSRYESFGLVVVEAMAAGVPVITSDIEGPCEILKGGALGTLFRTEDDADLARAMGVVFANWPRAFKKAREAQAHAAATFGFDAGRLRLRQAIETIHAEAFDFKGADRGWMAPLATPLGEAVRVR